MRWDTFLIKEALQIKEKNPPLNNGLKASKESITALIYYKLIDSTNYFCMSFNFYCNTIVNFDQSYFSTLKHVALFEYHLSRCLLSESLFYYLSNEFLIDSYLSGFFIYAPSFFFCFIFNCLTNSYY